MKALIGLTLGLVMATNAFASNPSDIAKWGDMTGKVGNVNVSDYPYSVKDGVGTLVFKGDNADEKFGAPGIEFDAKPYHGKKMKLSAEIKSTDSISSSIWMRVDGQNNKMLEFDNGVERGLRGTNDWTPFEVTLPISSEATKVLVGALQIGNGKMSLRNVKFEAVE